MFSLAVEVPRRAGYQDFKRHRVGHGIGLEAHEPPVLASTNHLKLEKGMTLCIEAPYHVFGWAVSPLRKWFRSQRTDTDFYQRRRNNWLRSKRA